jgi:hypothetical protein
VGREIGIRRHTDADEDVLTAEGVAAAPEIGAGLAGGYHLAVSTGAQRATQKLACFLAALGQRVPGGVVVEPGLRSQVEDRWRAANEKAGGGALGALREADPELVAGDSERLGAALRRILDALPDGGRALVVGHSPTNEARFSASPAKSCHRSVRAPASVSSPATTATRSNPLSKSSEARGGRSSRSVGIRSPTGLGSNCYEIRRIAATCGSGRKDANGARVSWAALHSLRCAKSR